MPLAQQLYASVGGSLEVELWSMLPQGCVYVDCLILRYVFTRASLLVARSGLGTSSILAGTLLAAVAGVVGWRFDQTSLVHLVLILEQMLTTGGTLPVSLLLHANVLSQCGCVVCRRLAGSSWRRVSGREDQHVRRKLAVDCVSAVLRRRRLPTHNHTELSPVPRVHWENQARQGSA